jgi:hypothetical protein
MSLVLVCGCVWIHPLAGHEGRSCRPGRVFGQVVETVAFQNPAMPVQYMFVLYRGEIARIWHDARDEHHLGVAAQAGMVQSVNSITCTSMFLASCATAARILLSASGTTLSLNFVLACAARIRMPLNMMRFYKSPIKTALSHVPVFYATIYILFAYEFFFQGGVEALKLAGIKHQIALDTPWWFDAVAINGRDD